MTLYFTISALFSLLSKHEKNLQNHIRSQEAHGNSRQVAKVGGLLNGTTISLKLQKLCL